MNRQDIFNHIKSKKSFLCVGLDTDPLRIPHHLNQLEDPVFEFNKRIIDATHPYAIAYKPNLAFYEAQGAKGWESLQKTIDYIPKECFTIADAKSILSLLTLAASQGTSLKLEVLGTDEETAFSEVLQIFTNGFGEDI